MPITYSCDYCAIVCSFPPLTIEAYGGGIESATWVFCQGAHAVAFIDAHPDLLEAPQ